MSGDDKTDECSTISKLFDLLDKWRHLPNYQLERRADVFFALFFPEVLRAHLAKQNRSIEINPVLIPEFPIKEKDSNRSKKIDYLALSKCGEQAFLVELKTDMVSISKKQRDYLVRAATSGLGELVGGVLKICGATKKRGKYVNLLRILSQFDMVEHVSREEEELEKELDRLFENAIPVKRCEKNFWAKARRRDREFKQGLGNVLPAKSLPPEVEVIYIQPRHCGGGSRPDAIDFEQFASTIESGGNGKIRKLFACYLRQWADQDAGF